MLTITYFVVFEPTYFGFMTAEFCLPLYFSITLYHKILYSSLQVLCLVPSIIFPVSKLCQVATYTLSVPLTSLFYTVWMYFGTHMLSSRNLFYDNFKYFNI